MRKVFNFYFFVSAVAVVVVTNVDGSRTWRVREKYKQLERKRSTHKSHDINNDGTNHRAEWNGTE